MNKCTIVKVQKEEVKVSLQLSGENILNICTLNTNSCVCMHTFRLKEESSSTLIRIMIKINILPP